MREEKPDASSAGDTLDMKQFDELYVEHQRAIYKHIFALLPDPAHAEEVFQNTCLAVLRKADQFKQGTNFLHWAAQIARYETYNYRRRLQADKLRFSESTMETIAELQLASSDQSQTRRDALRHCVSQLKDDDRELIVQRYREGTTADALAEQLGRTAHSVRKSIRRVRAALRECIERTLAAWERSS